MIVQLITITIMYIVPAPAEDMPVHFIEVYANDVCILEYRKILNVMTKKYY